VLLWASRALLRVAMPLRLARAARLPLELLAWQPRVLQEQQLLLMLLWGSCNLKVTQNMRTLLLVASADYPHHLLRGTRPGTARTRRVAFVWPFFCSSCEQPGEV